MNTGSIERLEKAVNELPEEHRGPILSALLDVKGQADRRKVLLKMLQEALSDVRLQMKYLIFDLECTRQELDRAKK